MGFGCLLIPLFQNMSPRDWKDGEFDIRDRAPVRPSGYFDDPAASYVPMDFSGHSLGAVEDSFLTHNFSPLLLRTQYFGLSLFHQPQSYTGTDGKTPSGEAAEKSSWQMNVVNPSQLRLSYDMGAAFQFRFDMKQQEGVEFSMTHPLSRDWNVGIRHQTEVRSSQVEMGFEW